MHSINFTTVLLVVSAASLTVAATLSLLVRRRPAVSTAMFAAFGLAFAALAGVMIVDVAGPDRVTVVTESMHVLSLLAATHRRLLVILPLVASCASLCVLSVYRERIAEKHARDYRNAISFCAGIGLIATIVVLIESVI